MVSIGLFYEYSGISTFFFCFLLSMLIFSSSLVSSKIMSSFSTAKSYYFIQALTAGCMVKSILLMIILYNQSLGERQQLVMYLILQCSLLDFFSISTGCFLLRRQKSIYEINHLIFIVLFGVLLASRSLKTNLIPVAMRWTAGVSLVDLVFIAWRKMRQSIPYRQRVHFFTLLSLMMIQQLIYICTFGQGKEYFLLLVTVLFLQTIYQTNDIFYICLYKPWEEKIRETKKTEAMIQEQEKRCNRIVNLSHELKTPVNVIRSALDILSLDVNQNLKQDVKLIKGECNELMNLIQDMIDIQKINTRHVEVKLRNYNLVELLENVIDIFGAELSESKLVFNPQEEEINQIVDGELMQKGFMLLIGMLIKESGEEKILIEMKQDAKSKRISICFTCPGISQIEQLNEALETIQEHKELAHIEGILTLKLIQAILRLHETKLNFLDENQAAINFKAKSFGKMVWQNEREKAVLADQVRCRYIES